MLTKLLDHRSCGGNEPLRLGEHDYPQSTLMRNPERRCGVPGRLVIEKGAATRIGQGVSQHRTLTIAQT